VVEDGQDIKSVEPLKSKTFFELIVRVPVLGWFAPVACVKLDALPDLSSHWLTSPPLAVIVEVSAASSHNL
jgi:hypothetical protein